MQIDATPYKKLHFVLGMVNDKDIEGILELLPTSATYYFCKANIPRALDQHVLMKQAGELNLKGLSYSSVAEALKSAKKRANAEDLIFIGGSTFVVAEVV